jgi:hypothetical protein
VKDALFDALSRGPGDRTDRTFAICSLVETFLITGPNSSSDDYVELLFAALRYVGGRYHQYR